MQPTPLGPAVTTRVENLPIARPAQPLSGAPSLTVGLPAEDDFTDDFTRLGIQDASCPALRTPNLYTPCRQFNFVAPSTGVLRLTANWDGTLTEAVGLVAGDVEADPGWLTDSGVYSYANPKVVRVRVQAGENYRIMAFLVMSHLDYLGWLAGPFQVTATIE